MDFANLPFRSGLPAYCEQAEDLLAGRVAGDRTAIQFFHSNHPRFLDDKIGWLPKRLAEAELRSATLGLADAQLTLARCYSYKSWADLVDLVEAIGREDSPVAIFESAVEAVITGDIGELRRLLAEHPDLVRARSTRVTHHDPPVHGATLLHYIAANGVEGYRQKTPPNSASIAKMLLDAGAEADALAGMYGGQCTTMSLLVSSSPPAEAGLQTALADLLIDYGAVVEGREAGAWTSPLMTALAFGFRDTAEALVRRGARVDTLAAAAALGRFDDAVRLLPGADCLDRHRAMALSAQLGQVEIVRLLLDAGEDPNRYNPKGNHAHSTPLHQAVLTGGKPVVQLLVERGARLDFSDKIYDGTPLGWAEYCGRPEIAEYLRGIT